MAQILHVLSRRMTPENKILMKTEIIHTFFDFLMNEWMNNWMNRKITKESLNKISNKKIMTWHTYPSSFFWTSICSTNTSTSVIPSLIFFYFPYLLLFSFFKIFFFCCIVIVVFLFLYFYLVFLSSRCEIFCYIGYYSSCNINEKIEWNER